MDNKIYKKITVLIKNLFTWVFSNLIWTLLSFLLPISIITVRLFHFIKKKVFDFSIVDILILLFILFLIIQFYFYHNNKKTVNTDVNPDTDADADAHTNENSYDILDYYFEDYHKHLTVYKNGNGIIINSFNLVINNIDSITKFKRELNIEDAKVLTNFPSLREMKKTNLNFRFEKFCFRCKCINNKNLILSVEEKYWTDDSDNDDILSKNNPKVLKWILKMNPSCIETGKPYKIVYVISIPGMFPIENGFFREDIANKKGTHGSFDSSFTVKHKIKKFTYTVSFENELVLYQTPYGNVRSSTERKNLSFVNDNNIIYDKYIFSAEDLNIGSTINVNWRFKEKVKNRRKEHE